MAIDENSLRAEFAEALRGGAVSQEWADEIGVDGHPSDAAAAVNLCKRLLDAV